MSNQYTDLRSFLRSRWGIGVLVFLGVGAVLLVFDHRAHIAGNNLLLGSLLLVCVVMHLFMHGGHGGHGGPGKGGH